jgi:ferredoxin
MNFLDIAERLSRIDRSAVAFESSRCLHELSKYSKCEACYEICPVDAIQPGKPPAFDEEACESCLACLSICPTGAYKATDAVPALMNCAARTDAKTVELVCALHPSAETGGAETNLGIQIRSCLAGLGTGAYLILTAVGVEQVITRIDACAQCPWGSLVSQIEKQVKQAQKMLAPWDLTEAIKTLPSEETTNLVERPLWDADNPPLSRRDLFRMASRQGQLAAARVLMEDKGTTPKSPSHDRKRSLNALKHFSLQEFGNGKFPLEGFDCAKISVSEDCTACGVCARTCPTGALQFIVDAEIKYQLKFSLGMCIDCEICVPICAVNAISISHDPTFEELLKPKDEYIVLQEGELVECDRCRTLIAKRPGTNLCPMCEHRLKHPFGSTLPPGMNLQDIDLQHKRES